MREIDAQTEKNHGITHSTTYVSLMKVAGGCVARDASAWAILNDTTLVVLVHYLETAISYRRLSSSYSSLSPSLINSISKPTTDSLLFTPRRFYIASAILLTLRFHSFPFDWQLLVLITHARIRRGRGQKLLSEIPQSNTPNASIIVKTGARRQLEQKL